MKRAVVTKIHDGLGYSTNDNKYIGKAYRQMITIVYEFPESKFLLTDFFIPEYIDVKNDYVHYGFLIVSENNIEYLE